MKHKPAYLIIILISILLSGCRKDNSADSLTEVFFAATRVEPAGDSLKSTSIICNDTEPTHAHIVIQSSPASSGILDLELFRLEGRLYTRSVKLAPGSYTVIEFFLYQDTGEPGYDPDDQIVMAIPESGSAFAGYTSPVLDFEFTVAEFGKTEVAVEVLCFQPSSYDQFGFNWFSIGEVVIREVCFYGSLCIFDTEKFEGSVYDEGGIQSEEVAASRIIVRRNGVEVPGSPFTNIDDFYEGYPLCVLYPDNLALTDNFTFELQVWVPSPEPGVFNWQTYDLVSTTDAIPLPGIGAQGVFDYVIGDCSPYTTNIYTWLPPNDPPTFYTWETAYASSGNNDNCFLNYGFSNWGWVLGPFFPQDNLNSDFDLYAAAGQCNITNAILAGYVHLQYNNGNNNGNGNGNGGNGNGNGGNGNTGSVTVTYHIYNPYIMTEVNIYAGSQMFPTLPNGNFTVAPGQYGNTATFPASHSANFYQTTINLTNPNNGFYVIAHAITGIPE